MTEINTQTMLGRIAKSVIDRFLRHVSWHASETVNLARMPGDHYPLIVILGREHYSERSKIYPALRRRDLQKVLDGELADGPPTLALPGPINGDKREVRFYQLDRKVVDSLPRCLFIVPESVLLGMNLHAASWADIQRQGYRYFLFAGGPSQPAGGALESRELVAMAAGIDSDSEPEEWHGSDCLLRRMRQALPALPALTWWSCRNRLSPGFRITGIAWKPFGLTAALMLFTYLIMSSLYLQILLSQRNSALTALGPEIQEGLIADNEARDYAVRRDALIEFWSGQTDTQRVWEGVALALQNQSSVNGLAMRAGRISIRGEAVDASEILARLGATPGFVDVVFDAPVRTARNGRQNFALSFSLAAVRPTSENSDE
jgi:hypothetical protein